jgi:hypothetical protein
MTAILLHCLTKNASKPVKSFWQFKNWVVMHGNGVWGAKHPKHHYQNHYFAALPLGLTFDG